MPPMPPVTSATLDCCSGPLGFCSAVVIASVPLAEPFADGWGNHFLGFAAHVNPDVAARELEHAVVLGPHVLLERARRSWRYQMVFRRIDVEHRHRDLREIHGPVADL